MPKTLFFDLDGTLLPMDTDHFVEHYTREMIPYIKDLADPKQFLKVLWESTKEMIKNTDSTLTNEQVFTEFFIRHLGIPKEVIWPLFDRFYDETFPKLKQYTNPLDISREIVEIAKEQERKIVISTNPVFPKVAIYERLRWLGLENFPFELVTIYEESHFCKPQLQYYQEMLDRLQITSDQAVMIGNDMQEDMVASQIGMETFLVTDYLIDRGKPVYPVQHRGTLFELKEQLERKEGVFRL